MAASTLIRFCVVSVAGACVSTAVAQSLPQPCATGTCGPNGPSVFVSAGDVNTVRVGESLLTIEQLTDRAILNWSTFNIGPDARVDFIQPAATSVALNRIFDSSPSRIAGALTANGQVYLINGNGIVFTPTAQVDVGSLLASSLEIDDDLFTSIGIANAVSASRASLEGTPDSGFVVVEDGAEIGVASGGRVLLFAPEVRNDGSIVAPDGQVLIAASEGRVYLSPSADSDLRGLLVEVDVGGVVLNNGSISSPRGNVTLMGASVNQNGLISATTSVQANGSIRLLAQDGAVFAGSGQAREAVATSSGELNIGAGSVTTVLPETDSELTAVDEQPQALSEIRLLGRTIDIGNNAVLTATGGRIDARAIADPRSELDAELTANDSMINVGSGVVLDVSGDDTAVIAMERNILEFELRGNELADSPIQRDGPLRGSTVAVDARRGTPLADTSAIASTIQRDVGERLSAGGEISLFSQGAVVLAEGSILNVSGGSVRYEDGFTAITRLAFDDGRIIDIGNADPDLRYSGIADVYVKNYDRWGVMEMFTSSSPGSGFAFEQGYIEGKDAGAISIRSASLELGADVIADTIAGRYQRQLPTALPDDVSVFLRPFEQAPAGGRLSIDFRLNDVLVRDVQLLGDRPAAAPLPDDGAGDAGTDDVFRAAAETLSDIGLGELSIRTNGRFEFADDAALTMQDGGRFAVRAGETVLAGDIDIVSGVVEVRAETAIEPLSSLTVVEGASIDVSGRWVNDNPVLEPPLTRLAIDGGRVDLSADGDLVVESGSMIEANGGAWLDENDVLTAGVGGDLSFAAEGNEGTRLTLDGALSAFALHTGGGLTAASDNIRVTSAAGVEANAFVVDPDFFRRGGFERIRLIANTESLRVDDGEEIRAEQQNYDLIPGFDLIGGQRRLADLAEVLTLPLEERRASSVELDLAQTVLQAATLGVLEIGTGATVAVDPGGSIALVSDGSIVVDGTLSAPAGSIGLRITTPQASADSPPPFRPEQGIWLDSNALLDASAAFVPLPNDDGFLTGNLLDAGTVSLTANRGYIATHPTSLIDVSGLSATLDLPVTRRTVPERVTVAAPAGSIAFTSANGMVLSGRLDATPAPDVDGAAGGSLSIAIDAQLRGLNADIDQEQSGFDTDGRNISLVEESVARVVDPGTALPEPLRNNVDVSTSQIEAAGFDDVSLLVENTLNIAGNAVDGIGSIRAAEDVSLALRGNLLLGTSVFDVAGRNVSLRAAGGLTLGQPSQGFQPSVAPAPSLAGTAVFEAGLIELLGQTSISGAARITLSAEGDARFRGVQILGERELLGGLLTAGDLEIAARRVYPTTLSSFELESIADEGTIRFSGDGGSADPVFSAAGSLTARAARIEVDGTALLAPLGRIELTARDSVDITEGAVVSTSLGGLSVPFGRTQGGFDWIYPLDGNVSLLFESAPEQSIELSADVVNLAEGSTIDLRGGGDLVATEFVPGPGGSQNVVDPENNGESFAIVPLFGDEFAPFDPLEGADPDLVLGQTIELVGAPGVPAGEYAILPAAYALLPGAFLITPQADTGDFPTGESISLASGGVVVAGRYGRAGSDIVDSRWRGFAVEPGSIVLTRSEIVSTSGNEFFADAGGRLPQDAGTLELNTQAGLTLEGELLAAPAEGGLGSTVSIASSNILLSRDGTDADDEQLVLNPDDLQALGAASLIIGGRRDGQDEDGATALTAAADRIVVDEGTSLDLPELILIANESVEIESGAVLSSSAGGEQIDAGRYATEGDSGVVRVSQTRIDGFDRNAADGESGRVTVAAGAAINAPGGDVLVDGSEGVSIDGDLDVAGGALRFGAPLIVLGSVARDDALVLDPTALSGLDLELLSLRSPDQLLLDGSFALNLADLDIRSAGLRAVGGGDAVIAADTVRLSNPGSIRGGEPGGSSATLDIVAAEVALGEGVFALDGFAETSVDAGLLSFAGDGGLLADDLTVSTGLAVAADGVTYRVDSRGADLQVTANDRAPEAAVSGLGSNIQFAGAAVGFDSNLLLPAGGLTLDATAGDVVIGSSASIDLAGVAVSFADQQAFADAGRLVLRAAADGESGRGGSIRVASGADIDLSAAAGGGRAGEILLDAPDGSIQFAGTLSGNGGDAESAGLFRAVAGGFDNLAALLDVIAAGGFQNTVALRQTGPGDLLIGDGTSLVAGTIALVADQGAVDIRGQVAVPSETAGSIEVFARDAVRIDAGGRVEVGEGGHVSIGVAAADGTVTATENGLGVEGAELSVRVVEGNEALGDRVRLAGLDAGVPASAVLEVARVFDEADGSITAADINRYKAYLNDFATTAAGDSAGLLAANGIAFDLRPGVEVRSDGDLALNADWDLLSWRAGDQPGFLTLRAGGSLLLNGSLSDGVTVGQTQFGFPVTALSEADSWGLGLVAGADLGSADALATAVGQGDLRIGNDVVVRTGTGDIDLAAGRDILFGNASSAVYTTGRSTGNGALPPAVAEFFLLNGHYPEDGGDVSLRAGRDVIGRATRQLVAEWLFRRGPVEGDLFPTVAAVYLNDFAQGLAAFGGGTIEVSAGRDILDLSASIPETRQHVGEIELNPGVVVIDNSFVRRGGGDIRYSAGRDILGGRYYADNGVIELFAGGDIGVSRVDDLAPVLMLGNASSLLSAGGSVTLQQVLSPSILRFGSRQGQLQGSESYFYGYGAADAVTAIAKTGDIRFINDRSALINRTNFVGLSDLFRSLALIYPGSLNAAALRGSLIFENTVNLYPVPEGGFQLYAWQDITSGALTVNLTQADGERSVLPDAANPADFPSLATAVRPQLQRGAQAQIPGYLEDMTPNRIIAQNGSISAAGEFRIVSAEPVEIVAGTDILDLRVESQNLRPTDRSLVQAGRNILFQIRRSPETGELTNNTRQMEFRGPGRVDIVAGDSINLGTSNGITTTGDQFNPALADSGADLTVITGLNQGSDFAGFGQIYVVDSDTYREELVEYLANFFPMGDTTSGNAVDRFQSLSPEQQQPFLIDVLFAELEAAGVAFVLEDPAEVERGYDAINTLFPEVEEEVPGGDLSLFFSRLQTLDGGTINILAPRGEVNAGLAATFAGAKPPSELGIVAQLSGDVRAVANGDFQVNRSRVFALDGGDILIWSSFGNIDAGRGAKTALSAPPPRITVDQTGNVIVEFPPAIAGSGIRAAVSTPGREPGDVLLFAPAGIIDAGDAGIFSEGNAILAALRVEGADNIDVGGGLVGVDTGVTGLAADLGGVSNVAADATRSAEESATESASGGDETPLASQALGFLEVFILGFGDEDESDDRT